MESDASQAVEIGGDSRLLPLIVRHRLCSVKLSGYLTHFLGIFFWEVSGTERGPEIGLSLKILHGKLRSSESIHEAFKSLDLVVGKISMAASDRGCSSANRNVVLTKS